MEVILKSNPNSLETSGLKNSNQMLILILVFFSEIQTNVPVITKSSNRKEEFEGMLLCYHY